MRLRNLNEKDTGFMVETWSGQGRLEGYNLPKDMELMKERIRMYNTKLYDGRYYEVFGIEVDDTLVGLLDLYEIREDEISIGISIDSYDWRQGYAYNAMQLAFAFLKEKGKYHVVSNCRQDNFASIALHKKCGYQFLYEDISKKSGAKIYRYELFLGMTEGKNDII